MKYFILIFIEIIKSSTTIIYSSLKLLQGQIQTRTLDDGRIYTGEWGPRGPNGFGTLSGPLYTYTGQFLVGQA